MSVMLNFVKTKNTDHYAVFQSVTNPQMRVTLRGGAEIEKPVIATQSFYIGKDVAGDAKGLVVVDIATMTELVDKATKYDALQTAPRLRAVGGRK